MNYYGLFRKLGGKKVKTSERVFSVDAQSYHDALYRLAPIRDWLGAGWTFDQLSDTEFRMRDAENCPALDEKFQNLYYEAKHDYQLMLIEGTRLLGLRDDGKTPGYGAYLRVMDMGETCYACMNGKFYEHDEVERLANKQATPLYDPRTVFQWAPVLFPYKDGLVDMTHYLLSDFRLAFPIQLWNPPSMDEQIKWIMKLEGMV